MPARVVLQGDIVVLEPLEFGHGGPLLAAASADRSTFAFTRVPGDAAAMEAYVSAALDEERAGAALPFAVRLRPSGEVVGSTRFMDIERWWPDDDTPSAVEIGSTWLAAAV